MAIHDYFRRKGFFYIHTPLITASDCEGAGEMFHLSTTGEEKGKEFFGKPAYLTVSGQLEAELLALGLSEVYTFRPHVPCRELQHSPSPERILDGGARDGFLRTGR